MKICFLSRPECISGIIPECNLKLFSAANWSAFLENTRGFVIMNYHSQLPSCGHFGNSTTKQAIKCYFCYLMCILKINLRVYHYKKFAILCASWEKHRSACHQVILCFHFVLKITPRYRFMPIHSLLPSVGLFWKKTRAHVIENYFRCYLMCILKIIPKGMLL